MIDPHKGPLGSILTDEDCACLERVESSCAMTAEVLAACQRAGFDVKKAAEENERQRQQAAALRAQAYPEKP